MSCTFENYLREFPVKLKDSERGRKSLSSSIRATKPWLGDEGEKKRKSRRRTSEPSSLSCTSVHRNRAKLAKMTPVRVFNAASKTGEDCGRRKTSVSVASTSLSRAFAGSIWYADSVSTTPVQEKGLASEGKAPSRTGFSSP